MNENDSPLPADPALDLLFAQARAQTFDTSRAEYGFETRLTARLREQRATPALAWGSVSWRMLPIFALVVLLLGGWRVEVSAASQDTLQAAALNDPEAADMLANFN